MTHERAARIIVFVLFAGFSALAWLSFVFIFSASTKSFGGLASAFLGVLGALDALLVLKPLKPRKAQK